MHSKFFPYEFECDWLITCYQIEKVMVTSEKGTMHLMACIDFFLFQQAGLYWKDEREKPEGIAFLSKPLLLFEYCHYCLAPNLEPTCTQTETLLTIRAKCNSCQ